MPKPFPARLHVLLAREAPLAVVLRRGPANAVCSLLWDRRTDRFELGQWLRGRIYERRADLSPDGRHLIYFARNSRLHSETRGSWTAVSRAPWLKAVVLLGKGDCWQGGGLFLSNTLYWVNGACCHFLIRDSEEVRQDTGYRPGGGVGGECLGVYFPRLLRDGWAPVMTVDRDCHVFEKALPHGWVLRKFAHAQTHPPRGKACYWDEHELEHCAGGAHRCLPDWDWADWDGTRLVWAAEGCLHGAALDAQGLGTARLLHDFNDMQFERRQAPY